MPSSSDEKKTPRTPWIVWIKRETEVFDNPKLIEGETLALYTNHLVQEVGDAFNNLLNLLDKTQEYLTPEDDLIFRNADRVMNKLNEELRRRVDLETKD